MLLENKIILVTGASRGIGTAIAEQCLLEGATIIGNYKTDISCLASLAEQFGEERVFIIQADVAAADEVKSMIETAAMKFGHLDGLVCNAGIITRSPDWKKIPFSDWEDVFQTNLIGVWNTIRYGVDHMKEGGSIISISSIYGTSPDIYSLPYSVSKAAVESLTKAIAKELAPRIRVNSVSPGNTLTSMVPEESVQREIEKKTLLKRSAQPVEIAKAVVFLLSEASSYIVGNVLHVDGGYDLT